MRQPAQAVAQQVEGVGRHQVLLSDQAGQQRVFRQPEELVHGRESRGDNIDGLDPIGGVDSEQQQERGGDEIGGDHRALAVPAVDADAG